MDALLQAIKNLDQTTFQQMCFQIMSEKYPNAAIHYVEGPAGDEGADQFAGILSEGPTIWQCKAFQVTVIGDPQKEQIRDSLRTTVEKLSPKLWILCLNMNLDIRAHRWFQNLQKSYASRGLKIADPVQGIDIARELLFRSTLRRHYFPAIDLDVAQIKSLISGVANLDDAGLEHRASETVDQWLARIATDPRLTYEVTFGGNRGPTVFPPPVEPGLVFATTDGRKTIKAFVRDPEALRLDPIRFTMHLSETGANKARDMDRTGRPRSGQTRTFGSSRAASRLCRRLTSRLENSRSRYDLGWTRGRSQ